MDNQLKKVLKLAKKTKDRVIVFDADYPEEAFVLMDFAGYESLMDNNENKSNKNTENIEKKAIESGNDDKENQTENSLTENKIADKMNKGDKMWKEDKDFTGENVYSSAQILQNRFKNNNWQIPEDVKAAATKDEAIN